MHERKSENQRSEIKSEKCPHSAEDIDGFKCPITLEFFKDPVVAADGHTYERKAISQWLKNHTVSPMTGKTLTSKILITNWALKKSMEHTFVKLQAQEQEIAQSQAKLNASEAALKRRYCSFFNLNYDMKKDKEIELTPLPDNRSRMCCIG